MTIAVSGCCDQFTLFTYWSIIHCQSGVTSCDFAGNLIELRCQDEIAFGESIDLVCPDSYGDHAPTQQDVWMVSLLFGYGAD